MGKEKKLTLRLRPGEDDDLIAWAESLQLSYGKKGVAIKNALRRGIRSDEAPPAAQLDTSNLLAEIRQVVEATMTTTLATISIAANTPSAEGEEDEYAKDCLDQLGSELLFDLDEEDDEEHW
jgi:hypothetical protein